MIPSQFREIDKITFSSASAEIVKITKAEEYIAKA